LHQIGPFATTGILFGRKRRVESIRLLNKICFEDKKFGENILWQFTIGFEMQFQGNQFRKWTGKIIVEFESMGMCCLKKIRQTQTW